MSQLANKIMIFLHDSLIIGIASITTVALIYGLATIIWILFAV